MNCEAFHDKIHTCKLEADHKGNHWCSHMCDDWETEPEERLKGYKLTISVETPDGFRHEQVALSLQGYTVPWLVTHVSERFLAYLETVDL